MIDSSYNRQLIAQFEHCRLSQGQEGYSITVTDTSTMEVVDGCRCIPSLAGVGLQPYYGIVTNWKRIVEKHGSNIKLDLSRTPELTVSAVKDGAFASEYIDNLSIKRIHHNRIFSSSEILIEFPITLNF